MGVAYNMNVETNVSASASGRRSPHTLSKEEVTSRYGPFFQESIVMAEYAHLVQSPVSGVYILPSNISPLMWYGIMIIQAGLYDGGLFKFTLSIPINYPDGGCPRIDFQSGVFHPQIDFYTGELETKKPFPRWRREVNYLRDLLSYARNIFLTIDILSPLNEEAAKLYSDSFEDFKERVKICIQTCKESALDTDPNDPHSIDSWHADVMRAARQDIFEPEFKPEESSSSGLSLGLSWVKKDTYQPFSKGDTH